MPIAKEILDMLHDTTNFSIFFYIENTKTTKNKFSHCAMALDYSFQWLSMAPSQRIIALCVHTLRVM